MNVIHLHLFLPICFYSSVNAVQVPVNEILECKVFDNDTLSEDEFLGMTEIDIGRQVASIPNGEVLRTYYLAEVRHKGSGEPPPACITLHIQWVPFDID